MQNPEITLFEPPYLHSSDRAPFLSAQLWRILIAVAKTYLLPSIIIIQKQFLNLVAYQRFVIQLTEARDANKNHHNIHRAEFDLSYWLR